MHVLPFPRPHPRPRHVVKHSMSVVMDLMLTHSEKHHRSSTQQCCAVTRPWLLAFTIIRALPLSSFPSPSCREAQHVCGDGSDAGTFGETPPFTNATVLRQDKTLAFGIFHNQCSICQHSNAFTPSREAQHVSGSGFDADAFGETPSLINAAVLRQDKTLAFCIFHNQGTSSFLVPVPVMS